MTMLSSRYTKITDANGNVISVRKPKVTENYSLYTVKQGDTMDLLAARLYGDPTQYWRIADLNPHISFPDLIKVGDVLRLPQ